MLSRRLLFALCLIATPAPADDPAPWQTATAIVKTADADAIKSGIPGVRSHVADLEKALADGVASFPPKPGPDCKFTLLVDGQAESLVALMTGAKASMAAGTGCQSMAMVTAANPYPEIGLLLALHYNEARQPQDALRVIDTTFKLKPVQGAFVGAHDAGLLSEQAASYVLLKRWSDALASQDAALKASQTDRDKARSNRGRGFALVELGQLNDAVAAYQESLRLEPNNTTAQGELAYIARLRAGAPTAPPRIFIPGAQPSAQAPTPAPAPAQ